MEQHAITLIILGLLFFVGLLADTLGRRLRLPRVTILLAIGLLIGRAGFDLLPDTISSLYPLVSVVALSAVAFLLGSALSLRNLRQHGRSIVIVSLVVVIVTQLVVSLGFWLFGAPLVLALVMGALATATDPAATFDVIEQSGKNGPFAKILRGLVALDDAWGMIAFTFALVLLGILAGENGAATLAAATREILGSVLLGAMIGVPGAFLTGRLTPGEPMRIEALGLVFLTAGGALMLDLSFLIAGMTAGTILVNLARHHTRTFREIRNFEWPFLIVFFVLAGAVLDPVALLASGWLGLLYLLLRVLGRQIGGLLGGRLAATPAQHNRWYGAAMLPQAGVAIGMALIASEEYPEHGPAIMALAIGSTVVFELIGPIIASHAMQKAGG